MITIDGQKIELSNFPDRTLHMELKNIEGYPIFRKDELLRKIWISWYYDNDAELFALEALVDQLRDNGFTDICLQMPYIPHARMDRVHDGNIFTLKTFAKIINRMNFTKVSCYEAHSNVSLALLDRVENISCQATVVHKVIPEISKVTGIPNPEIALFYPDEGAMKRYAGLFKNPYVFGMKKRDWQTGNILGLDVIGDEALVKDKTILIVDDICSKGGTFLYSAKKLRAMGAKNVFLYVTHCENTVLTGALIKTDLLNQIYTSDSIFTGTNDELANKISIVKYFRG